MANHVRSRVEVESPTKEIHEFMSKFDDSCTGLFETESGANTCKVVFGDDWKYNIDDDEHDDGVSRGLLGTKRARKCENNKKK